MNGSLFYIVGVIALTTGLFSTIVYERHTTEMSNKPVVSHVLDLDMNDEDISVQHGFSFGVLYGFEPTSAIAIENDATVAINGMFYNDLGMPLGTLIHEGRPLRIQNLDTPMVLIGSNNEVAIANVHTSMKVLVGRGYAWLYGTNGRLPDGSWVLFDRIYGKTTRVQRRSTNYVIENNRIVDVVNTSSPFKLDQGDAVLTYAGIDRTFRIGDAVSYDYDYGFDAFTIETGFQTGGWLVKDSMNVAKDYELFLGYTTAPQPRTLVGVTGEGHLLFVVVDGRRPGYSLGVSGRDAAKLMISYGCTEAAYLDGGASSTMINGGVLVNKPSGKAERSVAHAILIYENN